MAGSVAAARAVTLARAFAKVPEGIRVPASKGHVASHRLMPTQPQQHGFQSWLLEVEMPPTMVQCSAGGRFSWP